MKSTPFLTIIIFILFSYYGKANEYNISNISIDQVSPAILSYQDTIHITFDFEIPQGNVNIYAMPEPGSSFAYGGTNYFPDASGHFEGFFIAFQDAIAEKIHIVIIDIDSRDLLYEEFIEVDFTFVKYALDNIVINPGLSVTLSYEDTVTLAFDYSIPNGDVYILVEPSPSLSFHDNDSPLKEDRKGHVSGYIISNQEAEIHQIKISIVDANTDELLYVTILEVNFVFTEYAINNVIMNPISPAALAYGDTVFIDFNYSIPRGNVRIFIVPIPSLPFNFRGSPIYEEKKGYAYGYFFTDQDAIAEQIQITIVDADTEELLYEELMDVNFIFTNYALQNITFQPGPSAVLSYMDTVYLNFDYSFPKGNVYIYVEASPSLPFNYDDPPLKIEKQGHVSAFLTSDQAIEVHQITISVVDAETETLLEESVIEVDFVFREYAIQNIVMHPISPATLTYSDTVYVDFDYSIPRGNVRIFLLPKPSIPFKFRGSPVYEEKKGHGYGYFFTDQDATAEQIQFTIVDVDTEELLYKELIEVAYIFASGSTAILENQIDKTRIFPNPSSNTVIITTNFSSGFVFNVFDQAGKIIQTGRSQNDRQQLSIEEWNNGIYYIQCRHNNTTSSGKFIKI